MWLRRLLKPTAAAIVIADHDLKPIKFNSNYIAITEIEENPILT